MGDFNPISSNLAEIKADLRQSLQTALLAVDGLTATVRISRTATVSVADVRRLIIERKNRGKMFPQHLFADPAWDMLLELYAAELAQLRLSTSTLCGAATVPQTTALRWINTLEKEGLVSRRSDPTDRRRFFIRLSSEGVSCMRAYFEINAQP